jgi:hypothetical protein
MANLKVIIRPLGSKVEVVFNRQQLDVFDSVEEAKHEYEFADIVDEVTPEEEIISFSVPAN